MDYINKINQTLGKVRNVIVIMAIFSVLVLATVGILLGIYY